MRNIDSHPGSTRRGRRSPLRVPDGPWCQPTWQVVEPAGDRRRQAADPAPSTHATASGTGWAAPPQAPANARIVLRALLPMVPRRPARRLHRMGNLRSPTRRRPARLPSAQIVDFRRLPQVAADEIRFVVATKVRRGDWTPNTSLRRFLMVLIDTADGRSPTRSPSDPPGVASAVPVTHWPHASSFDSCAPLHSAFLPAPRRRHQPGPVGRRPLALARRIRIRSRRTQSGSTHTAVDWSTVTVPWLRTRSKNSHDDSSPPPPWPGAR